MSRGLLTLLLLDLFRVLFNKGPVLLDRLASLGISMLATVGVYFFILFVLKKFGMVKS